MTVKRVVVCAVVSSVAVSCSSCGAPDGDSHPAKAMGDGRIWTTENLRLAAPGSYCHGDAAAECERSGRLYTWASALDACGRLGAAWRLPTDDEWRQLATAYGGVLGDSDSRAASAALRTGGSSGFNAALGGNRNAGGDYARLDEHGLYWTATESDPSHAWMYNFGRAGLSRHRGGDKSMALSVRCIQVKALTGP